MPVYTVDGTCCCGPTCCDPPIFGAGNVTLTVSSENCPCVNGEYELENIGPNIWQLNISPICDTINFISVECSADGYFLIRFTCFNGDNVFIARPSSQTCDPLEITWTGLGVLLAGVCMGEDCILNATLVPV